MATKLRWEFPQQEEMHTVEVCDLHIGKSGIKAQVRNCLHGYDEQGALRKVLYCTRDGRFFVRKKDGWRKLEPATNCLYDRHPDKTKPKAAGGGTNRADMRQFNHSTCHRLVAYAWCEHPSAAMHDSNWYKRYEVDHLNGDRSDWTADNLQWVTPQENDRRAQIMRKLRKMGIDPKLVYIRNLKGIYRLEEAPLEYFMDRLPEMFAGDTAALSVEAINMDVAKTLDKTEDNTLHCSRCGCAMIKDTEEHYTHSGVLCDCCYGDLYE